MLNNHNSMQRKSVRICKVEGRGNIFWFPTQFNEVCERLLLAQTGVAALVVEDEEDVEQRLRRQRLRLVRRLGAVQEQPLQHLRRMRSLGEISTLWSFMIDDYPPRQLPFTVLNGLLNRNDCHINFILYLIELRPPYQ